MKTDRLTIQMVVIFLGAACLLSIGGLIVLSFIGRPVPEPLTTLGATAIGALGSMLARTSTEAAPGGADSSSACPLPDDLAASGVGEPIGEPSNFANPKEQKGETKALEEEGD